MQYAVVLFLKSKYVWNQKKMEKGKYQNFTSSFFWVMRKRVISEKKFKKQLETKSSRKVFGAICIDSQATLYLPTQTKLAYAICIHEDTLYIYVFWRSCMYL